MNKEVNNLEKLKMAKGIFQDNYERFIELVSNNQEEVSNISTKPIDNYMNNVIKCENRQLLRYFYQDVKYYLNSEKMYTPKIEEGMAILISKAVILESANTTGLINYFSRGDFSMGGELSNPFEEISRVLLYSIKNDSYVCANSDIKSASYDKLQYEDRAVLTALNLAVTKNGVINKFTSYGCGDAYNNLCLDLELSSITSSNVRSATTKENRGLLLNQFDMIFDTYCIKLDYERMITGFPTESTCNKLKSRFEDKLVYTKRNIGVYERTKRLVKMGQY